MIGPAGMSRGHGNLSKEEDSMIDKLIGHRRNWASVRFTYNEDNNVIMAIAEHACV